MLLCVELETKEGGSVLEIFYIYKMGETAAGKKTKPGRNGTSTITLPRGGAGPWGKEKSTTTRGSGG
jgi:hypothetical protein